ncbi:MAG: hypothetical protein LBF34_03260 [Puniceicoccales bacterium]|nr:hypothetical protein [Puniceicoccales bacterium]
MEKDSSLGRILEQAGMGIAEGVAGDAARHGVQKIAGKVPGVIAEGTAAEAARCAVDNNGGIIQDLWGIARGAAGAALGALVGPVSVVVVGMLGEAAGKAIGKLIEDKCEETEEQPERKQPSEERPVAKKEKPQAIDPHSTQEKSSDTNKEEDPKMQYYCRHCNSNFRKRRFQETNCGSECKNSCPKCGCLGPRTP